MTSRDRCSPSNNLFYYISASTFSRGDTRVLDRRLPTLSVHGDNNSMFWFFLHLRRRRSSRVSPFRDEKVSCCLFGACAPPAIERRSFQDVRKAPRISSNTETAQSSSLCLVFVCAPRKSVAAFQGRMLSIPAGGPQICLSGARLMTCYCLLMN